MRPPQPPRAITRCVKRHPIAALSFSIAVGVVCLAYLPAAAETSFPYKAYAREKNVYVRSGPGEQFYPTEKLQRGAEVEVYRRRPDGWLGIRPLAESYSWVSGRHLRLAAEGLAETTADRVPARVGSQFSDIRDVVQVYLRRGETVEVKATRQLAAGPGAGTWYKIAPPPGEFRWIDERSVDKGRDGGKPEKEERTRGEGETVSLGKAGSDVTPCSLLVASTSSPLLPVGSLRKVSAEGFQAELDDINTELSIMLAEESTVWSCDELRQRCEALLAQAETALERGRARALINRMAQADDIKQRLVQAGGCDKAVGDSRSARGNGLSSAAVACSPPRVPRPPSPNDRYDGTGRLARVEPSKLGAPRYALLDEHGDVLYYVSPAPGLNLQYYVGREVGVTGQQGYIADGGATHIMARHVTALDSQLR